MKKHILGHQQSLKTKSAIPNIQDPSHGAFMAEMILCLNNLNNFIDTHFKTFLISTSALFAIYFFTKKLGSKVTVKFTVQNGAFLPERISDLTLINEKDNHVIITSIHAVFEKDLWLELHRCEPPLVLKPHDMISLPFEPYSYLSIGSDTFEPDFINAKIFIFTDKRKIECRASYYEDPERKNYRNISINTNKYNDFVYDKSVIFILVYVIDGNMKTAFIDEAGFTGNEWDWERRFFSQNITATAISAAFKNRD